MKIAIPILLVAIILGGSVSSMPLQITESAKGAETRSVSYDWQAHQKRIDRIFEKHIPEILKTEKQKISAIAPNKAVEYMRQFEAGLRSSTGIIMIEGQQNRWLELAYRSGYAQKAFFRTGYLSGLAREAEENK